MRLPVVPIVLRGSPKGAKALLPLLVFVTTAFAQAPTTPRPPLGAPQVKRTGKTFVDVDLQENCKGRAIRLEVPCELNNGARLKEAGLPNDSIISLRIPDGFTVTLYVNDGFGGASQTFTGKAETLGNLKGQASSLKADVKK